MKTIILCGGLGYRLKEETEWKPKPMILVGGKPILWHIMKIYAHYGYSEFILALGYKADYIKEFFLNQEYLLNDFTLDMKNSIKTVHGTSMTKIKDDFSITFVDTGVDTLPGERILKLERYITEEDFMVTYGDGVTDLEIPKLVEFHKKQNSIGTVTGVHLRSAFGLLKVDRKHMVTDFEEKPLLPSLVNGGFMIFKKKAMKYFKAGETEHEALKRLVKKNQLSVYQHKGFWHSMDTYKDVENLNELWAKNAQWKVW